MRDNARRLLTILTVIRPCGCAGLLAAVHRQPVIFSLCILLAGGAALWRQRRRAVSRQRSEIVLPPRIFRGSGSGLRGYRRSVSRAFGARRNPSRLVSTGRQRGAAAAGAVPAAARPALVSQVSVLLAVVPEHHPPGSIWRSRCATGGGVSFSAEPAKRSAAGVERVLGDAAGGRESRWFTVTPERAGLRCSRRTSAPVGCRVAAGGQPCLTPASDAVAGEHSVLGRKRSVPAIPRPAGGTSPLNLCAAGICLTPVAAVANNLWQQQIAGITTLSRATTRRRSSPAAGSSSVVTAAPPRGQPPDARCWSCRWRGLPLSGAGDAGFLYQQPAPVRSVGDHLAVYHRLSGTPPTPKLQAQQRLRADSRLLDDWLRRGAAALSAGLYQGRLILR